MSGREGVCKWQSNESLEINRNHKKRMDMHCLMNIKLKILIASTLFLVFIAGCATSSGGEDVNSPPVSKLIQNKQYSAANKQLDEYYSDYSNGDRAETLLLRHVSGVMRNVLPKDGAKLVDFFDLYGKSRSGQFLEAVYFYEKGLQFRGTAYTQDTEADNLALMRDNFAISRSLFQSILDQDPSSYLAYSYLGTMSAYVSSRRASEREFRKALAINPGSFQVWRTYLNYELPRWGGSYGKMNALLEEMRGHEGKNKRLRNLQGLVLVDKAEIAARDGRFTLAEDFIFQAWEYAPYRKYGQILDFVYFNVSESGDKVSACRIAKKTHELAPRSKRYLRLSQECDAAGL